MLKVYVFLSQEYKENNYSKFQSNWIQIVDLVTTTRNYSNHFSYKCMKKWCFINFGFVLRKILNEKMLKIYVFLSQEYKENNYSKFQSNRIKIVNLVDNYSKILDHFSYKYMEIWCFINFGFVLGKILQEDMLKVYVFLSQEYKENN